MLDQRSEDMTTWLLRFLSWDFFPVIAWLVLVVLAIVGFIILYRIAGSRYYVPEAGLPMGQEELRVEISRAFSSGTKIVRGAGGERVSHFRVTVELTLKSVKPSIHLSWVRLHIAGEDLDPIGSTPELRNTIDHPEETYEIKYEVPVKLFLKSRYAPGGTTPETDNARARVHVKADGKSQYSGMLEIDHLEPTMQ